MVNVHPFGGLLAAYTVGLLLCWVTCLWLDFDLVICWFVRVVGLRTTHFLMYLCVVGRASHLLVCMCVVGLLTTNLIVYICVVGRATHFLVCMCVVQERATHLLVCICVVG